MALCKRKADAVELPEDPPARARRCPLQETNCEDDDYGDMSLDAQTLEDMLPILPLVSYSDYCLAAGGEFAAPEYQQGHHQPDDDDDDVTEISLDEFLGSSSAAARAAHQPGSTAASCVQAPPPRHGQSTDGGDVIESSSSPETKLMVASSSPEQSSDVCGLACPPAGDEYVEQSFSDPLVQSDPAFIEEFFSDP